ncbi:MAG: hypothetical protein J7501_04515 [Bdellovibrio sp.]|nr:hypothetical protein [Bdellovibrio sp.]
MKNAVLATAVLMMAGLSANAMTVCAVSAETQPNEYTQVIVQKVIDSKLGYTVVLEEDGLTYGFENSADQTALAVTDRANQKLLGAVSSSRNPNPKGSSTVSIILPAIKRAFSCTETN